MLDMIQTCLYSFRYRPVCFYQKELE